MSQSRRDCGKRTENEIAFHLNVRSVSIRDSYYGPNKLSLVCWAVLYTRGILCTSDFFLILIIRLLRITIMMINYIRDNLLLPSRGKYLSAHNFISMTIKGGRRLENTLKLSQKGKLLLTLLY